MRWSRGRPPPATSPSAPSSSRRSPPSAAPARTSSSPTTPRTPPDGFRPDRHAEAPQPQGRRGGAARRLRPAPAQRDAGLLPDRAAPVRRGGTLARRARGACPDARAGADRRPDHPPGDADLRHARAGLRLDARRRARGPRAPMARGQDRQLASGRVAQLPAQPRLQHVVHDRRRGGLEARPPGHARPPAGADRRGVDPPAPDAEALQDPHGPRHVRRDRGALRRRRRGGAPELERQPYDDFDRAVIRATQGDLPVVAEPYVPAAAELGITVDALIEHLHGMVERGLLRRVAAILFHRRAGFSANGMGVWKVPEERVLEIGPRMASFRGISHCYQRPTYEDWPYQLFTMAHGRSKEECDAVLDAVANSVPDLQDRAILYSSTEFKKVRLLYFTDDFRNWEREHAGV